MIRKLMLTFLLTASFFIAGTSYGGLLIDAGVNAILDDFSGGNYVAGTEFTSLSTQTIRSLGYLDAQGNGLDSSHQVGLWDTTSQALLAMVTVTPISPTLLSAQGTGVWYMEDITALVLPPGTYRVAGITGSEDDADSLSDHKIGNGVTLLSGYVRNSFPGGGFNYPNLVYASEAIRATLSTSSVVPEPTSLALVAVSIVFCIANLKPRRHILNRKWQS